jgi:hypothetical protein
VNPVPATDIADKDDPTSVLVGDKDDITGVIREKKAGFDVGGCRGWIGCPFCPFFP